MLIFFHLVFCIHRWTLWVNCCPNTFRKFMVVVAANFRKAVLNIYIYPEVLLITAPSHSISEASIFLPSVSTVPASQKLEIINKYLKIPEIYLVPQITLYYPPLCHTHTCRGRAWWPHKNSILTLGLSENLLWNLGFIFFKFLMGEVHIHKYLKGVDQHLICSAI